jgi:hypothetical protein
MGDMTTTTALILNSLLMAGVVGALATAVRLGLRLPTGERRETLRPFQALSIRPIAVDHEQGTVSHAA